jgi:hypothetical protein
VTRRRTTRALSAAALVLAAALAGSAPPPAPALPAGLVVAAFPLFATEDDTADAELRTIMPMTTALPWGAVGFLDNGCTGTLIDAQHVLAASHCFTFDYDLAAPDGRTYRQGDWQPTLAFFPNYHPGRATPPRYLVDRVIVGSRTQTFQWTPTQIGDTAANDWGIAHLATPVTGFPALELAAPARWQYPLFIVYAGYPRDPAVFPAQQGSYPEPLAAPPGLPASDSSGYCVNFKNACWWIPALADPKCLALQENGAFVEVDDFSCLIQGGNSGTAAVWDAGPPGTPLYRIAGVFSGGGGFWNAAQFLHAPRFAAGVAVAAADDGSARTQVFATDRDLGRVVSRERDGFGSSDPFHYYRDLGAVPGSERIAAFKLQHGRPQVVVVTTGGALYTAHVAATGAWQPWHTIAPPPGVTRFVDVDAAYGADGFPFLYALPDSGPLYVRRAVSTAAGATWAPWQALALGATGRRVSAVRHEDGRQQVFVVSTAGTVLTRWQVDSSAGALWTPVAVFADSGDVEPLADLDAGWSGDGTVQVFALAASGALWQRRVNAESPQGAWSAWTAFPLARYAPASAAAPVLDGVASLTFSRLQESGAVVPVLFATDVRGNVYVTTPRPVGGGWRPWRSFYK